MELSREGVIWIKCMGCTKNVCIFKYYFPCYQVISRMPVRDSHNPNTCRPTSQMGEQIQPQDNHRKPATSPHRSDCWSSVSSKHSLNIWIFYISKKMWSYTISTLTDSDSEYQSESESKTEKLTCQRLKLINKNKIFKHLHSSNVVINYRRDSHLAVLWYFIKVILIHAV